MAYATHNKLEEKVSRFMQERSRVLISPGNLQSFIDDIHAKIAVFNYEHRNCKPVKIFFEKGQDWVSKRNDYVVRWNNYPNTNGRHIVEFQILASKSNTGQEAVRS